MSRKAVLPTIASLLFLLFPPVVRGADTLTYSGASTISLSILYAGATKAFEEKTGIRFNSIDTLSGTGKGLEKLAKGAVTLAGAGRDLTPAEKGKGLVQHLIAFDALAVWVNRDNPADKLTRAQIKGIFTGKIRNWKEVGGNDRPILTIIETPGEGRASLEIMQKTLLDNLPLAPPGMMMDNHRDQILEVSRNPGAISCGSQGLQSSFSPAIKERIKIVSIDGAYPDAKGISSGAYPATRPLNLVTLGPPADSAKRFIEFILSPAGQAIIAKNFVPLTPAAPAGARPAAKP